MIMLKKDKNSWRRVFTVALATVLATGMLFMGGSTLNKSGSTAYASTTSMYDWEFNSATAPYQSLFTGNDLTVKNGASVSSGSLSIGEATYSQTDGKYATLNTPITMPSKYSADTQVWSIETKFSEDPTAFDSDQGGGAVLLSGTTGSYTPGISGLYSFVRVLRPYGTDLTKYGRSKTDLEITVVEAKSDGNYYGRAAYIPNITDDMIKAGITVSIKADSSGQPSVSVNGGTYYEIDVPTSSGVTSNDSKFNFDDALTFDAIGNPMNAFNVGKITIDYLRYNVEDMNGLYVNTCNNSQAYILDSITGAATELTKQTNGTYTDKSGNAMVTVGGKAVLANKVSDGIYVYAGNNYGDVNNDGTLEMITSNGDGTYKYNGINYKWNTTSSKFEVATHSVTYNLNGGTNSTSNGGTYTEGKGLTLSNPTRSGFTFAGWTNASGTALTSISSTSTSDVALTANWVTSKMTVSKAKVGKKRVKVTWKAAANANSGYQISVNTKKSGTKVVGTVTKSGTVTYTKTKLKKGKKYYVSVRAYQTVGGTKIYGGWSKVVKTAKVK